MFPNYLIAALRHLTHNSLHMAINIIGLAIGLATAMLIALYIRDETSFDRAISTADRTYIMHSVLAAPGRPPLVLDQVPGDLAVALSADYPQAGEFTQLLPDGNGFRHGNVESSELFYWADPNVFAILSFPVLHGDLKAALQRPDGLVLTRRLARRYFGMDNAVGQVLEIGASSAGFQPMTVTAVLQDFPSNTNFTREIFVSGLASTSGLKSAVAPRKDFLCNVVLVFRAASITAANALQRDLRVFLSHHRAIDIDEGEVSFELRTLKDTHLMRRDGGALRQSADRTIVLGMGAVGLLIVLIAGINFVNLMTARASTRSVEIGVRKAAGAERRHLMIQFIGESLLYTALGMVVALALTELLLPVVNAFLDKRIEFHYWSEIGTFSILVATTILVGIFAGAYPAFVLSSFNPVSCLRSRTVSTPHSGAVRRVLVVTQFAILTGLLVATGVIYCQTRFAMTDALRFNKDHVVLVQSGNQTLVDELRGLSGVADATLSDGLTFNQGQVAGPFFVAGVGKATVNRASVDFGFFEFYGIKPLAGRLFMPEHGADSVHGKSSESLLSIILNERAVHELGFSSPQSAIGKIAGIDATVETAGKESGYRGAGQIIGVIPDFTLQSVRQTTNPMFYFVDPTQNHVVSARLRGRDIPETLAEIEALSRRIFNRPAAAVFLDQYVRALYLDEQRKQTIFAIFAGVAAFIACLGLFGLAAFTAQQRTKEIGIRKAMGADTTDIVRLLLWQFTKPVLVSNLVAWPVAAFAMSRWLQGFANHIDLEAWLFVVAAAVALIIALMTVSVHSVLIARSKPITALRCE